MALSRNITLIYAFLLSGNILIGMGPVGVYAGEKSIWSNKETWKKANEQIVRLSPSAFPELPKPMLKDLNQRGCSIPQPVITGTTLPPDYETSNVISGEFQKPGQTDWAVLCSVEGRSTILVFWNGSVTNVEQLGGFSPDKRWLQGMGTDRKTLKPLVEYSRGISSVGESFILDAFEGYGGPEPPPIDHEGIDDAFLGKASQVRYWYKGEWLRLQGAD
ncbi:MAG: hypothetical protein IH886_16770 [Nitrospinae bacterium]|nr:hypothetical protein [Nitrospinota bacterium]